VFEKQRGRFCLADLTSPQPRTSFDANVSKHGKCTDALRYIPLIVRKKDNQNKIAIQPHREERTSPSPGPLLTP
jgi:hypothetical protein